MTRVLLLEDNDSLAASIVGALTIHGHTVRRFGTLAEARAAIPPFGFDVLLCDYELPGGTGLDFLREVDHSSFLGLDRAMPHQTTILWSGVDRTREVEAAGLPFTIDHVRVKNDIAGLLEILDATGPAVEEKPLCECPGAMCVVRVGETETSFVRCRKADAEAAVMAMEDEDRREDEATVYPDEDFHIPPAVPGQAG